MQDTTKTYLPPLCFHMIHFHFQKRNSGVQLPKGQDIVEPVNGWSSICMWSDGRYGYTYKIVPRTTFIGTLRIHIPDLCLWYFLLVIVFEKINPYTTSARD